MIPPKASAEFVAAMEDVLEVYQRPGPRTAAGGAGAGGTLRQRLCAERGASVFLAFEPLAGWRGVQVTAGRTRQDFAQVVQTLIEGRYREADTIVLVMDQLNTHSTASLYEAFAPEEARRLAERLEIHPTPKHGSWLAMAEIELSALARDLPERIGERADRVRHVAA